MEHLSFDQARKEVTVVNAILLVTDINPEQANDRIIEQSKEEL